MGKFTKFRWSSSLAILTYNQRQQDLIPHWQEPLASKHGALFWFCHDASASAASASAASAVAAEMAQCALQEPKEEQLRDVRRPVKQVSLKIH